LNLNSPQDWSLAPTNLSRFVFYIIYICKPRSLEWSLLPCQMRKLFKWIILIDIRALFFILLDQVRLKVEMVFFFS
jgi:hypothetical protein